MARTTKSPAPSRKTGSRQSRRAAAPRHDEVEAALAALAHEVRTPLNGILALAELLAASELPERERGWAADMREAADHIAKLTTLVVEGARSRGHGLVLQHQPFDPRAVARTIASSLAARAQTESLTVTATIAPDLPGCVSGDLVRLRSVLENLIDNAVKFTPRGRVVFTANSEVLEAQRVRLVFTVHDDGIGLSKAEIARLFRPFAQANDAVGGRFGGTGLGLSLARNVARAMGGDLTVQSTPGIGSTFRFAVALDLADAAAMADGEEADDLSDAEFAAAMTRQAPR